MKCAQERKHVPAFAWLGGCILVISSLTGVEAAAIMSSEYQPFADGNSESSSVDRSLIMALVVAPGGGILIIMPR